MAVSDALAADTATIIKQMRALPDLDPKQTEHFGVMVVTNFLSSIANRPAGTKNPFTDAIYTLGHTGDPTDAKLSEALNAAVTYRLHNFGQRTLPQGVADYWKGMDV